MQRRSFRGALQFLPHSYDASGDTRDAGWSCLLVRPSLRRRRFRRLDGCFGRAHQRHNAVKASTVSNFNWTYYPPARLLSARRVLALDIRGEAQRPRATIPGGSSNPSFSGTSPHRARRSAPAFALISPCFFGPRQVPEPPKPRRPPRSNGLITRKTIVGARHIFDFQIESQMNSWKALMNGRPLEKIILLNIASSRPPVWGKNAAAICSMIFRSWHKSTNRISIGAAIFRWPVAVKNITLMDANIFFKAGQIVEEFSQRNRFSRPRRASFLISGVPVGDELKEIIRI